MPLTLPKKVKQEPLIVTQKIPEHARISPENYVIPEAFPHQAILGAEGAEHYARDATELSFAVVRDQCAPVRMRYCSHSPQIVDIFAFAGWTNRPVVVFLHGGAWTAGYPWWGGFLAAGLLKRGLILAAPSYRLAPVADLDDQLADIDTCLDWVQENINQFGGDPSRIIVSGHSAGGHLAILHALRSKKRRVSAVASISSAFDLRRQNYAPDGSNPNVYRYLLKSPTDQSGASPILFADALAMPLLMTFGGNDLERVVRTSCQFGNTLTRLRKDWRLRVHPNADHFVCHLQLSDPDHPWFEDLESLLS